MTLQYCFGNDDECEFYDYSLTSTQLNKAMHEILLRKGQNDLIEIIETFVSERAADYSYFEEDLMNYFKEDAHDAYYNR